MSRSSERASSTEGPGNDDELVAACLRGDERAWDCLIDTYAPYIHAVAVRAYGLRPAEAAEVFQDSCIRIYFGLHGYTGKGGLRSWLRAVVISACREYLRQAARTASHTSQDQPEDEPAPEIIDELDAALDVRAAVDALGEPCRSTLALHFFEDLSQAEVARRLNSPEGTIAARVSRCLQRLRANISDNGEQERAAPGPSSD